LQSEKQDLHNTSTDAGISILIKPLRENVDSSIRCSFEFDSNVTHVSNLQQQKQSLHKTSTDAGTSILVKRLNENAYSSIRCNFEFDSNVTDVNEVHLKKQDLHNTSTDAGTLIVVPSVIAHGEKSHSVHSHPANADSSIRCNFEFDSNVIDVSDSQQ
jgi:hypothetical protein